MSFKDEVIRDSVNIFLNPTEWAEPVSYTVNGGSPKTINAVIDRKPLRPATEDNSRVGINDFNIYISNDVTNGIPSVTTGKDKVTITRQAGSGQSDDYLVVEILESDPGMWALRVRR